MTLDHTLGCVLYSIVAVFCVQNWEKVDSWRAFDACWDLLLSCSVRIW